MPMLTVVVLDKLLRPLPARINVLEATRRIPRCVLQCLEERLDETFDLLSRGGSWDYIDPHYFRCANRLRYDPDVRDGLDGFRLSTGLV